MDSLVALDPLLAEIPQLKTTAAGNSKGRLEPDLLASEPPVLPQSVAAASYKSRGQPGRRNTRSGRRETGRQIQVSDPGSTSIASSSLSPW